MRVIFPLTLVLLVAFLALAFTVMPDCWVQTTSIFLIAGVVCGGIGSWVAYQCGRNRIEGFVLGFVLGPIGILLEAMLPKRDAS